MLIPHDVTFIPIYEGLPRAARKTASGQTARKRSVHVRFWTSSVSQRQGGRTDHQFSGLVEFRKRSIRLLDSSSNPGNDLAGTAAQIAPVLKGPSGDHSAGLRGS